MHRTSPSHRFLRQCVCCRFLELKLLEVRAWVSALQPTRRLHVINPNSLSASSQGIQVEARQPRPSPVPSSCSFSHAADFLFHLLSKFQNPPPLHTIQPHDSRLASCYCCISSHTTLSIGSPTSVDCARLGARRTPHGKSADERQPGHNRFLRVESAIEPTFRNTSDSVPWRLKLRYLLRPLLA